MGPTSQHCAPEEALSSGPSNGPQDCQDRCTANTHCMFYHVLPGRGNWCRLSETCAKTVAQLRDDIVTFKKRVDVDEWARRMADFESEEAEKAKAMEQERIRSENARASAQIEAEEKIA